MATPAGVTVTSVLGAGSQGTVRLGTVDPAVLGILRGWSHGPVAVKTWDREEDGAAVAASGIVSSMSLPSTTYESGCMCAWRRTIQPGPGR